MHKRGWNEDQEYVMKTIKGQFRYLQEILTFIFQTQIMDMKMNYQKRKEEKRKQMW